MTQLPEPDFIERDPETITNEWIALYEEKTGTTLQPAQIERTIIDVGAYRETLLRIGIQETAKSNLLNYAPIDVLKHLGQLVGVNQLEATYSQTTLKFTLEEALDFDLTISKGTEIETKDGKYIFTTDEDCVILEGELEVTVGATSTTAGTLPNDYELDSINSLLTPLGYIDSVTNIVVSFGGIDEEDVESLRERIRLAPESFSNAGSVGAYEFHTLSANQTIIDVSVESSSPGVVDIYPLTSSGNPSAEILAIVQDYLSDEKIRPLTDYVQVLSPTRVDFSIKAKIYIYIDSDSATVQETIENKLVEYKETLALQLGKSVILTQIIAILNAIYGVYKVELVDPVGDIEISNSEWANLENYEVTIEGVANE